MELGLLVLLQQVQRLNEHIAKQHADKLEGNAPSDDKAAQPAAATLAAAPQKPAVRVISSNLAIRWI